MNDKVSKAYAAFQRGAFADACRLLASASDADGLHLRGLAEQKSGELSKAVASLSAAIAVTPGNHEIHNNLGLTYRKLGQFDAAAGSFEQTLALSPSFVSAQVSLARTCLDLGQWDQAYARYAALTHVRPGNVGDAFGLASAGLETGEVEQAAGILDALIQHQDRGDYRFMRGRASLELQSLPQSLDDFTKAHAELKTGMTLSGLVNLLWMMGDDAGFERTLSQNKDALPVVVAENWLLAGDASAALNVLSALEVKDPVVLSLEARIFEALGDHDAQIDRATRALDMSPDDEMATTQLVIGLMATGRNAEANRHIQKMLTQSPGSQHWLAYGYTAWRLGDATNDALFRDAKSYVRQYELEVPAGYEDAAAFNHALASELASLKQFEREPLNQSFKGGAQSARDLSRLKTGAVAEYVSALDVPIQQYLKDIGTSEHHPTSRLNGRNGYRFAGMWSIEMKPGGRHVNHIHPEGWISSAYYVAVPDSVSMATDRSGWFHYGQPPHSTYPALEPTGWVAPVQGQLILFPSWMWHGTMPFHSDERRLTAPFDLVPNS